METPLNFRDELLRASTEDEGARLGRRAAFEEVESLAADLTLFELFARAEVLRLDVGAGRGDAAARRLDNAFEIIGRDAAGTEDVAVREIPDSNVNRLIA